MKKHVHGLMIVMAFVCLAIGLHFAHYLIFKDPHHLFIYGLGDLAFLPFEVLLVTFVLHRVLEWREHKAAESKINILVGSFFSELGISLISSLSALDDKRSDAHDYVTITNRYTKKECIGGMRFLASYKPQIRFEPEEMEALKHQVLAKRSFLSGLMQHPILIEHKSFTDLLLALFHLLEELQHRESFNELPENDVKHLTLDLERVYKRLLPEWLHYMYRLKGSYPFLFSLYLRLNPVEGESNVVID